jgi:hypothetical protein
MSQPEVNPPSPLPPPAPPPGSGLLGCGLIAVGALVVIPSGLCTAFGGIALVMAFFEEPGQIIQNLAEVFPLVALTLVSLAVGVGLIWAGWRSRHA